MCSEKHVLIKMFTNVINIGLAWRAGVEKTVLGVETDLLSSKGKFLGTAVSEESHTDSVLGQERTHHYWFPLKRNKCEQCFQLLIL